mmetsp:Transcript_46622/g.109677  ORF Transcript_46622/g.109677 Transcript_46622/m.109677 type:complete len:258 (-) Transcript_46622:329-1102(-)
MLRCRIVIARERDHVGHEVPQRLDVLALLCALGRLLEVALRHHRVRRLEEEGVAVLVPGVDVHAPAPEQRHVRLLDLDRGVDKGGVVLNRLREVHPRGEHVPGLCGLRARETRAVEEASGAFVGLKEGTHARFDVFIDFVPLESDRGGVLRDGAALALLPVPARKLVKVVARIDGRVDGCSHVRRKLCDLKIARHVPCVRCDSVEPVFGKRRLWLVATHRPIDLPAVQVLDLSIQRLVAIFVIQVSDALQGCSVDAM